MPNSAAIIITIAAALLWPFQASFGSLCPEENLVGVPVYRLDNLLNGHGEGLRNLWAAAKSSSYKVGRDDYDIGRLLGNFARLVDTVTPSSVSDGSEVLDARSRFRPRIIESINETLGHTADNKIVITGPLNEDFVYSLLEGLSAFRTGAHESATMTEQPVVSCFPGSKSCNVNFAVLDSHSKPIKFSAILNVNAPDLLDHAISIYLTSETYGLDVHLNGAASHPVIRELLEVAEAVREWVFGEFEKSNGITPEQSP